ncbi:hypothetical protein DFH11DRAFT_1618256 [Phellopilus nigrolimitatus]|nr:hypothetical protein DFH11DRAFT_1618256 [Phellopilus nigrolimitatus]
MSGDTKTSDIQVTLKNGDKVKVNDHVYCSPNWSIRDGTPYSVARIMEFLPPEVNNAAGGGGAATAVSAALKGKARETYTRVRLAWYYRPSDVSDRNVADARLLLAAIYSEICDVAQLRARCYVVHRDKLGNLADWKRRPDRFYFHRLFDPYIKKEFEVLLATDVRNLPQHIRDVLVSRYEYVVAEKEVVPDLTDSLRLCETCGEWCAHLDAVQCARCKGHFHMSCVNPPLVAKPARGYGWTCAPCSRRHEDQLDGAHPALREGTPKAGSGASVSLGAGAVSSMGLGLVLNAGVTGWSSASTPLSKPRGRGRPRKERPGAAGGVNEEELQVKHYKLWPFRYFGLYTVAEDTMDPDDLIFPRAATRVGPKYQATVAPAPGEPAPPASGASTGTPSSGPADVDERGGDSTVEVLSIVHDFTPREVETLEKVMQRQVVRKDQIQAVDWLTEIVRRASQARLNGRPLESVSMKTPMRSEKWKRQETRYTDREWNDEEVAAFEDGIAQFGAELRSVRDEVGTRSMPQVVRFYGKWKNARLREENARLREPDAYKKAKIPRSGAASPAARASSSMSDAEDASTVDVPTHSHSARSSNYCAACRTRESHVWWKAPKGLATSILCDSCGINWRKYADLNARPTTREETALNAAAAAAVGPGANGAPASASAGGKTRGADKREGTPLTAPGAKRAKVAGPSSAKSTPPPGAAATQHRCLCCWAKGAHGKVLKCTQCGVGAHAGACGAVVEPEEVDAWLCELCENEKTVEYALNTDCLLCPHPPRDAKAGGGGYPPPNTYLRICKPTEGQGWVHALCSVFVPEVQYADAARLRVVEAISTIPKHRWTTKCSLCNVAGGAVVRCGNCPKEYHVSCAWKYGHKFGFEIQPVKSSRRDVTNMVTFKRETGAMNAVICCKEHTSYRRMTYDICEVNDVGETALQVYARTYKQAPVSQSHSLLRKAHRLDQLLHGVPGGASAPGSAGDRDSSFVSEPTPALEHKCAQCGTEYSPFFHPAPEPADPDAWVCHRCHFETQPQPQPQAKVEQVELADVVMVSV